MAVAIRLVHPYPSSLDAAVVAVLATLAGASPARAVLLAVAMLALQAAIGAVNDLVDAPRDAIGQRWKPIPAGVVATRSAVAVAGVAALVGLVLAAIGGLPTLVLALVVLAIGGAYDLRLKGTPWSWLPFAVGIPVLPVFAWVGAAGRVPTSFLVLIPAGVLAGAALALANSLVDLDGDRVAGVRSPAQAWGRDRTRRAVLAMLAAVGLVALATAAAGGTPPVTLLVIAAAAAAAPAAGLALGATDRTSRERAWEAQAAAVAVLAAGWVGGLAAAGRLG